MSTRVRLVDVDNPFACLGHKPNPRHSKVWKKWRGREIEIGVPQAPEDHIACNTDVVWPVLTKEFKDDVGEPYNFVVCRHQIQAGD